MQRHIKSFPLNSFRKLIKYLCEMDFMIFPAKLVDEVKLLREAPLHEQVTAFNLVVWLFQTLIAPFFRRGASAINITSIRGWIYDPSLFVRGITQDGAQPGVKELVLAPRTAPSLVRRDPNLNETCLTISGKEVALLSHRHRRPQIDARKKKKALIIWSAVEDMRTIMK